MWFLVAVGACLMAGLFTRLACVLGAGFLVMTYLTYPPFPWYPLPPNTEGNPVFINKNVIERLALLALASMPDRPLDGARRADLPSAAHAPPQCALFRHQRLRTWLDC